MAESSKLHIALFPWLAFGHMIPYLELAKAIAKKGHKITFISTPKNIDRLPKLPPNLTPLVSFVKLPLPLVNGLPENSEATSDLPSENVRYLKKAFDELKQPLTLFLQTNCADLDWIFYDFAPYWLPPIASSLGISHGFFSIYLAAMVTFMKPKSVAQDDRSKPEDFTRPPKWVTFPSNLGFKMFEILKMFEPFAGEDDISDIIRSAEVIKGCDVMAFRSSFEFEPEYLNLLEEIHAKPCLPLGMLPTTEHDDDEKEIEAWKEIKKWLDKQGKNSVVYVAFGSEAKSSQLELNEIATGLELSGLPFFWVLKKRRGLADTEVLELPDGFEERTAGRGLVWNNWAPQLKILGHESVGGFLTHSGWTSVVEASMFERPLILLTFYADQGINARLLEDKKMAYPIPRNENDGSFDRESVAESLKLVMVKEEGQIYRNKAKEMKLLFADLNRQDSYIGKFVDYLERNRGRKNIV